jgi:hypothetical protein
MATRNRPIPAVELADFGSICWSSLFVTAYSP